MDGMEMDRYRVSRVRNPNYPTNDHLHVKEIREGVSRRILIAILGVTMSW